MRITSLGAISTERWPWIFGMSFCAYQKDVLVPVQDESSALCEQFHTLSQSKQGSFAVLGH